MAADVPPKAMSPGAIANFLWFHQGEWLPIILVSSMAIAAFGVIIWTSANANEKNWTKKWQELKGDDYGSIADISEAIAHPSERWCAILPSLLLVAGLLGTFIGLGISLDAASRATANKIGSIAEIDQVLIGLGAKFKTSTWGIIFFLFVRITSKLRGWENERLNFCIVNVKNQKVTAKLNDRKFIKELASVIQTQIQHSERQYLPFIKEISEGIKDISGEIKHFVNTNEQNMGKIRASASDMAGAAQLMKGSAETMSAASNALEGAANGLSGEIQAFGSRVDETLGGIKTDLGAAIEGMSKTIGRQMDQMAGRMQSSTDKIEYTMNGLENAVATTMNEMRDAIKVSIDDQRAAASLINESVSNLLDSAIELRNPVETLSRDVNENVTRIQRDALLIQDLANICLENSRQLKSVIDKGGRQFASLSHILRSGISLDGQMASDVRQISDQVSNLAKIAAGKANISKTRQPSLDQGKEGETA